MSVSGGSAAVNIQEIDLSTRVPGFPGVYGAIVLPCRKGQIDQPVLVTSEETFLNQFTPLGQIEVGDSLAFFSATAFLQRSDKLWVKRVIGNNYKHGGIVIRTIDRAQNSPWVSGLQDPTAYTFGNHDLFTLYQSDPGVWSDDIAIQITPKRDREIVTLNSTNITSGAATSATGVLGVGMPIVTAATSATGVMDSKLTITATPGVAGNLTINIVGGGTAGSETAVKIDNVITVTIDDETSTQNQIRTALLTLTGVISTVICAAGSDEWVLADNTNTVTLSGGEDEFTTPSDGEINITALVGTAGNNLQIRLVTGATAAGAETATQEGEVITVKIKSGASTAAQIVSAILTITDTFASVVADHPTQVWTLGTGTDYTILAGGSSVGTTIAVSQYFGTGEPVRVALYSTGVSDMLPAGLNSTSTYYTIKSSSTKIKLAVSLENALAGQAMLLSSSGAGSMQVIPLKVVSEANSFQIEVFHRNNLNVAVESYYVSLTPGAKNGFGQNMFIEDMLNSSNYIRAMVNPLVIGAPLPQMSPMFFFGGSDGDPVTDGKMMLGADVFRNADTYPVTVFLDGGWASPAYQKHIDAIAQFRHDCVCFLSVPYDKEASANYLNDIVDYWMNILNLSSSHSALYTPHVKIYDKFNDRSLYVAPDGYAGAAVSFTAMNYEMWYPVAGFRRGQINVLDVRRRFSKGEMDYLYDGAVSGGGGINPIRFAPGKGIMIWGQKTLLGRPSTLSRLSARLLLCVIEPAIAKTMEDFLFEINDAATRAQVSSIITDYMTVIKARRGVYQFYIVCDDSNNPPAVIDMYQMVVHIFIQPVQAVEYIPLTFVITKTGSSLALNQALLGG